MNFDFIEGLTEQEINELYDNDLISSGSWLCCYVDCENGVTGSACYHTGIRCNARSPYYVVGYSGRTNFPSGAAEQVCGFYGSETTYQYTTSCKNM